MIHRVIIRPEAKRDLRDARSWYQEISTDLKIDFIRKVGEAIVLAQERPLAFPIVHRTFRRILLHRFPYALFSTPAKIGSLWWPYSIRLAIRSY